MKRKRWLKMAVVMMLCVSMLVTLGACGQKNEAGESLNQEIEVNAEEDRLQEDELQESGPDEKTEGSKPELKQETKPIETKPIETKPAKTKPIETKPAETKPVETRPVETKPVETRPVETKPVETRPAETKPVETKPAETKPVETRPAETKPAETKPAETKPAETKPAETKPAETKPAETKPAETKPEKPEPDTCYLSISCKTILDNMDQMTEGKEGLIPEDGYILHRTKVPFEGGETVFDILQKTTRKKGIHMDSVFTPMYNSAYIRGIGNLYEFDCGNGSGWMFSVNGVFPSHGASVIEVHPGDRIEFLYTCDFGADLPGGGKF